MQCVMNSDADGYDQVPFKKNIYFFGVFAVKSEWLHYSFCLNLLANLQCLTAYVAGRLLYCTCTYAYFLHCQLMIIISVFIFILILIFLFPFRCKSLFMIYLNDISSTNILSTVSVINWTMTATDANHFQFFGILMFVDTKPKLRNILLWSENACKGSHSLKGKL